MLLFLGSTTAQNNNIYFSTSIISTSKNNSNSNFKSTFSNYKTKSNNQKNNINLLIGYELKKYRIAISLGSFKIDNTNILNFYPDSIINNFNNSYKYLGALFETIKFKDYNDFCFKYGLSVSYDYVFQNTFELNHERFNNKVFTLKDKQINYYVPNHLIGFGFFYGLHYKVKRFNIGIDIRNKFLYTVKKGYHKFLHIKDIPNSTIETATASKNYETSFSTLFFVPFLSINYNLIKQK